MFGRTRKSNEIAALTAQVEALTALVQGQHNTPAPVIEAVRPTIALTPTPKRPTIALTPAPKKARKTASPEVKAQRAAAWEQVKADRLALSPLNKALAAQGVKGAAWEGRFENAESVAQALKALTPAERKAAKAALARKA